MFFAFFLCSKLIKPKKSPTINNSMFALCNSQVDLRRAYKLCYWQWCDVFLLYERVDTNCLLLTLDDKSHAFG